MPAINQDREFDLRRSPQIDDGIHRRAHSAARVEDIIDEDNKLRFRDVDILRTIGEQLYIAGGLAPGETVSLSNISNAIEGMTVRPLQTDDVATP